jgi:hypothetical protein
MFFYEYLTTNQANRGTGKYAGDGFLRGLCVGAVYVGWGECSSWVVFWDLADAALVQVSTATSQTGRAIIKT